MRGGWTEAMTSHPSTLSVMKGLHINRVPSTKVQSTLPKLYSPWTLNTYDLVLIFARSGITTTSKNRSIWCALPATVVAPASVRPRLINDWPMPCFLQYLNRQTRTATSTRSRGYLPVSWDGPGLGSRKYVGITRVFFTTICAKRGRLFAQW